MTSILLILVLIIRNSFGQWSYNDTNWSGDFPECGGLFQSPIDITINNETSSCAKQLELDWNSDVTNYVVRNTGHTLQAIPFDIEHFGGNSLAGLDVLHYANDSNFRLTNPFYYTYTSPVNREYCLDSIHFHWGNTNNDGSEHLINGKQYPLELHLVHYSCDYYLAGDAIFAYLNPETSEKYDDVNVLSVIGVLFEVGDPNPVLDLILNPIIIDDIFEYTPQDTPPTNYLQIWYTEPFSINDLLPDNLEMIAYLGSLTTPPCFETVRWNVLKNTMTVSQQQLEQFRRMLEGTKEQNKTQAPNYRPVQIIGNRTIYQCQEDIDDRNIKNTTTTTKPYSYGPYDYRYRY